MKNKTKVALAVIAAVGLNGWVQAETRTWTSASGGKVSAELVKVEGDKITLKTASGKQSTVDLETLSQEDQTYIKENAESLEKSETEAEDVPAGEKSGGVAENRKARWQKKFDRAKAESEKTGLPILVLFTGSSWCHYCVKLEDKVFSKPEFKKYANKNLVLMVVDIEAPGDATKYQKELLKEFGVKGYPRFFLTGADGKPYASNGYDDNISPETFAAWVDASKK